MAELNILTKTKPEIITELEYFTEDEAKAAEKRLGMFQTEFSLANGKRALQTITSGRYPTADDAQITMLSQIGISTSASTSGFTGVSASRLRGYLEIDEKTGCRAAKQYAGHKKSVRVRQRRRLGHRFGHCVRNR